MFETNECYHTIEMVTWNSIVYKLLGIRLEYLKP